MADQPRKNLRLLELLGTCLLIAWVTWVAVSSFARGASFSDALPYLSAPAFGVLGIIAGRRLRSNGIPNWFPAFLLTVAIYVLVSVTVQGGAGGGPLGYSNANAALGIQLAAVSTITALHLHGMPRTWALWAAGLSALAVPWTLSQAGITMLVPVVAAIMLVLIRPGRRRAWMIPSAILTVLAAGTVVLNIAQTAAWPPIYKKAFSGARKELWSDALELWSRRPLIGTGPGSFRRFNELARDPDTERVHMSLLQVGSELGWIGILLFVAFALVAFLQLARALPDARIIGTAALAALLIHSFVDHLLEFPAITLAMGTVIGLSSYSRWGAK